MTLHSCFQPASLTPHTAPLQNYQSSVLHGYHFSFRGHGLYGQPKNQHRWRPFRPLRMRKQRFHYHVYHRLKRAVHWLADVIPGRQSKHYFRSSRLPWSHSRWRCVKFLCCPVSVFLLSCPAVLSPSSCCPVSVFLLSCPAVLTPFSCCPVLLSCLFFPAVLSPSSCRLVLLTCLRLPAVLSPSSCCPVLLTCLRLPAVLSPSSCCPVSVFLLSCPAVLSPSSCCPVSVFLLSCLRPVAVLSPSSCCLVSVFLLSHLCPVSDLSRAILAVCLVAVWLLSCLHLDIDWNLFPIKLPFKPCTATRQLPCAWSFRSQQYHVKPQTHA